VRRVLAPGGRIILYGKDWDTFVTDSGDPELTRTIVCKRAEQVPLPRPRVSTATCCWTPASAS